MKNEKFHFILYIVALICGLLVGASTAFDYTKSTLGVGRAQLAEMKTECELQLPRTQSCKLVAIPDIKND